MAFPGELNINYYKGDTYEFKVYPKGPDGSIFYLDDYSNATFTIATERGSNPTGTTLMPTGKVFGHASIDGNGTYITCAITPENGEVMESNITYVYDVQVYAPGSSTYDKIFTLLTGSISVTDDVTQDIGTPNRSIPTYRIIYHNTNATSGDAPVDNDAHLPNTSVELKGLGTLARTGYYLAGWNTASDGNGTSYLPTATISSFNTDVKLYPKWVVNTVAYDNQSATTNHVDGSTTYTPLSSITTIPTTPPIRTDHEFMGWFTGPAGSGTQVTNGSYTPTFPFGPVILYAKWINNKVVYNDQSATTTYSGGSTHFVVGESIEFIPTTPPIRTGHTFGGWFTGPAGSGVEVTDASYIPTSPYGPVTIYAKWIPVYSVFYDDQGATTTYSGGSISYVSGQAIEEIPTIDPIRTGYVFSGWFTGPAGSGVEVTDGSYIPNSPYADVTLYAKWEDES
jgi:uncharacterized repeat protein (TIGR02543 family)